MARNYTKTQGTFDLQALYGVNAERDKTLLELGYSYQAAKDWFPAWVGYCEARGWSQAEVLSLYEFECAWNDALWSTDTYMGHWGYYRPPTFITQSRCWIVAPHGWYRVKFGCLTGLGRYSGMHPQIYSDRSGSNPGSTPGTCIQLDHAGWLTTRQPGIRACLNSTAWGADYGVAGGLAYTEGVVIENLRFEGGMDGRNQDTAFKATGVTMNEPGENSLIRGCMAANHNNGGYTIYNGTPGHIDTCSAFYNNGPGFDMLSSNGLCNVTMTVPSGDNNKGGLIRLRPVNAQSVSGGNFNIRGLKSESRTTLQKIMVVEGPIGQLNITIDGASIDYSGVTTPELIEIGAGGNGQWQVDARGVCFSSGVGALITNYNSGKRYSASAPWSGVSFCINDTGVKFASRPGITESSISGGNPAPTVDSFTVTPSSVSAPGQVVLAWQTSNATAVTISGTQGTLAVDGTATVSVSGTTTFSLTATGPGGSVAASTTVTLTAPGPTGSTGGSTGSTGGSTAPTGSTAPPAAYTELPVTGWVATAFKTNSASENPAYVLDNNAATVWSSGALQAPGHTFSLNLGGAKTFDGLLTESTWPQDFPRGMKIKVSQTGLPGSWTDVVTVAGTASNMIVWFARQTAAHVQFELTASNPSYWWTIGKLRLLLSSGSTGSTSGSTGSTSGSTGSTSGSTGSTSGSTGSTSGSTAGVTGGTASIIPPSSVIVVVNSDDPNSAALATAYSSSWGIPVTNRVTVSLGTGHCLTDAAKLTAARTAINAQGTSKQFVALCFAFPSRYGTAGINSTAQSITSAITFGARSVAALTPSVLFDYSGLTPFTTKGVRPSWLVIKQAYIRRAEHGARPAGYLYGWAAKDQAGTARGTLRAPTMSGLDSRANFEYVNLTQVPDVDFNYGENPYNSPTVWAFDKFDELDAKYPGTSYPQGDPRGTKINRPTAAKPLVAYFGSMYRIGTAGDVVNNRINGLPLAKGWYGDHLTSFNGYLPDGATPPGNPNGGQTPLTWFLDCGAALSVGSVSEPWSGNPASTVAPQFVNPSKFVPLWQDQRLPGAVAAWASVQLADRALVAGDGMCATFA